MKKVLTLVALAMVTLTASAENEISTISPSESTNSSAIEMTSMESMDFNKGKNNLEDIKPLDLYSNSENQNRSYDFSVVVAPTLYVGANFAISAPQYVNFSASSAHDLWLNNIIALKASQLKSKVSFTLGYGWKSNYFKMNDEKRFVLSQPDGIVMVRDFTTGEGAPRYSRVKTFSHTFSLLANWEIANNTNLRFGPTMSINTGKSIKTKYEDAYGTIYTEKANGIQINRITYDVMASLTYYGIGFYVKYAPQSVFKGNYGPQWSTMSLGLTVGF